MTTPLARLADATRHVAEMQLDRPIALTSSEELSELARSFNEMRRRLAEAMAEINGFTRSLEEKVEERTEQLKVAQQKLMQADRLASLGQLVGERRARDQQPALRASSTSRCSCSGS